MKMRNKQLAIALALTISSMAANAQEQNDRKKNFFNHMDFGVTAGSTGLGFDLAMPVGNYVRLRTGMSVVPRLEVPMTFGVQVGDDPATSQSKFERLSGYLSGLTGNKVKQDVDMIGKPKMWNWNFMFPCIVRKKPQVPNTARQAASLPGDISRGRRSSMPQPKTRPDSPVPSLQGPCDRSLKSEVPCGSCLNWR